MLRARLAVPLALSLLAGCVSRPAAPPAAPPRPIPLPAPAPPPPVANWADRPRTQGDWVYRRDERGTIAYYGAPGAGAALTLRCDRAAARVVLSRPGLPGRLTVTTTNAVRAFAATLASEGYVAVGIAARDPLLDAMVFSRGQFMVTLDGSEELHIPTWAEAARIVEDCRG